MDVHTGVGVDGNGRRKIECQCSPGSIDRNGRMTILRVEMKMRDRNKRNDEARSSFPCSLAFLRSYFLYFFVSPFTFIFR